MKQLTAKEKEAQAIILKSVSNALDVLTQHCKDCAKSFNSSVVPVSIIELGVKTIKENMLKGSGLTIDDIK